MPGVPSDAQRSDVGAVGNRCGVALPPGSSIRRPLTLSGGRAAHSRRACLRADGSQTFHEGRHRRGSSRQPRRRPAETSLLRGLVGIQPAPVRRPAGGDPPRVRPVVVGLGRLAGLQLDDRHQLLDERGGQLRRGDGVDEVDQLPHMGAGGAYCEPRRRRTAAPAHVLDDPLGPQRLVQLVGVGARDRLQHRVSPARHLDAQRPSVHTAGQATEDRDLGPECAGDIDCDLAGQRPTVGAGVRGLGRCLHLAIQPGARRDHRAQECSAACFGQGDTSAERPVAGRESTGNSAWAEAGSSSTLNHPMPSCSSGAAFVGGSLPCGHQPGAEEHAI